MYTVITPISGNRGNFKLRSEGGKIGVKVGRSEGGKVGRSEGVKVGRSEGGKVGKSEGGKVGRFEEKGRKASLYLPPFLPYTFHTKILGGDLWSPPSNKIYSPAIINQ